MQETYEDMSMKSDLCASTHSLIYKGWLIRDAFQRLLDLLEILRDEIYWARNYSL